MINHIYLETELSSTTQREILRALNKLGHPTTLIVPFHDNGEPALSDAHIKHVRVASKHWAASTPIFNLQVLRRLTNLIRSERPDVIMVDHCSIGGTVPYILLRVISKRFPRIVFDVRSQPVEGVGLSGFCREAQYLVSLAISARLTSGLTFLTRPMGTNELERVRSKRSYGVWESGVDLELFDPERWKSKGVQLRHDLGLDDSFVVFYHGHTSFNRGLDLAIRAFADLRRTGRASNVVFAILGDGGARSDLEDLAKDLGAPVKFLGRVPYADVPAYIAMSDVALIPLPDHDNWRFQHPLKFTEYLAMEIPVIVPKTPAFTNISEDSSGIFYLPEVTASAIADTVAQCYDDRVRLKEWSQGSRKTAARYSWEGIADRLITYLESTGLA
jgi:glycosyltransferase involved in cell wall biosynthesis